MQVTKDELRNSCSGTGQLSATLWCPSLTAPSWTVPRLTRSQRREAVVLFAEVHHHSHLHCNIHDHDHHCDHPQSLTFALGFTGATKKQLAETESSTTLVIATKAFRWNGNLRKLKSGKFGHNLEKVTIMSRVTGPIVMMWTSASNRVVDTATIVLLNMPGSIITITITIIYEEVILTRNF